MACDGLFVQRWEGTRCGPVLVFLHHGLGSVGQWRDFPAELTAATGLPGLAYDRCGHGRSVACEEARTPRYMHREAEVLGELLAREGVGDFVLIGHSDGGSIALLYGALEGQVAPRGIVAESAHVFVEDVTRQGIRLTVDAYVSGMREKLRRYHGENTERLFWEWSGTWLAPSFDEWNLCAGLRGVQCPVVVVQGVEDEYGTEAQVDAIVRGVPRAAGRVMIPGAAHEPHHQARGATVEAMRAAVMGFM